MGHQTAKHLTISNDGAVGSAGLLCEAFDYLRNRPSTGSATGLSSKDSENLQKRTFYVEENKSLAYIIGKMNMILQRSESAQYHPYQYPRGKASPIGEINR